MLWVEELKKGKIIAMNADVLVVVATASAAADH